MKILFIKWSEVLKDNPYNVSGLPFEQLQKTSSLLMDEFDFKDDPYTKGYQILDDDKFFIFTLKFGKYIKKITSVSTEY